MRILKALVLCPLLLPFEVFGQQSYVGRYDVGNAFTWLNSPSVHLQERGYHLQVGVNPRRWLALGFDYSVVFGKVVLRADELKPELQAAIGSQLAKLAAAGLLPPGYQVAVGADSKTQTFAAGPQLEYRRFERATLFVRPAIGAIYEVANPQASDPITKGIVAQLAPGGSKTEWKPFYGFGGGADVNFGGHFSVRLQADFVHNALFTDILNSSRNTVRLSIGPALHFGRNVLQ